MDLQIRPNETELAYIWRLGKYREDGLIEMTWEQLSDILNKNLKDQDEYLTESSYRKKYSIMRQASEEVFNNSAQEFDEIKNEKNELIKERIKISDERRELKALLREKAREENFIEQIERIFKTFNYVPITPPPYLKAKNIDSHKSMIIPCYDMHYGININNHWNRYNVEIAKERFTKYVARIRHIQSFHEAHNAHVIISECISGLIHSTLRYESNENVIEQVMGAVNLLVWFLVQLSGMFEEVNVYVAPGNHSRLFQNKQDVLKGENLDHLIMYCLKGYLQNVENIQFHENELDEGIAYIKLNDYNVFCAHGDKDTPENICRHITELTKIIPDYCFLGHKHFNSMLTCNGGCKVIQTGSFSGPDSYCMDMRLQGRPEQMVCIMTEYGLECMYDIDLR